MSKAVDMIGQSVKSWVVIGRDTEGEAEIKTRRVRATALWICKCKLCGAVRVFRGTHLRQGQVAICKCQRKTVDNGQNFKNKHGCVWCSDAADCSGVCKYEDFFEKHGDFREYEAAIDGEDMQE